MDRLLIRYALQLVSVALGVTTAACGAAGRARTSDETGTTEPSIAESVASGAISDGSSGTATFDSGADETSGGPDTGSCPPPDPDVSESLAFVQAPDWPESATAVTTECAAVSLTDAPEFFETLDLQLACAHPEIMEPLEVHFYFSAPSIGEQLDALPGVSGLSASFYWPDPDLVAPGDLLYQMTLRDEDGALLVLAYSLYLFDATLASGAALEVGRPQWLTPGTDEHEAWNAPLGEMTARNVDCARRESLRPGASFEIPLVVELQADRGPISMYDRSAAYGLAVGGEPFDIIVSDAFMRDRINCGDCPLTEITFLVLRSAR